MDKDLNDLNPEDSKPAPPPRAHKREERPERPKNSLSENLDYRIDGLQKAKMEPNMTSADIAALDRMIAKLKDEKDKK